MRPGVDFTNIFTSSFYTRSSQKHNNSVKLSVSFYAFWDLRAPKLLIEHWWNWHLVVKKKSLKKTNLNWNNAFQIYFLNLITDDAILKQATL